MVGADCSQSIALLSCLYVSRCSSPAQCDSSHSHILGIVTAVPSIWRALQCTRLYWDTGNKTTALPNCVKYVVTTILYISLSMYRIDQTATNRRIFVTIAIVQGVYTSLWDMYCDWNLGDPDSDRWFLRRTLAYRRVWVYYAAIVLNPVLRFSWILYIIVPLQLQYSTLISFGVSIGEVLRRALWLLLRVESEHCTHLARDRENAPSIAGRQPFLGAGKDSQQLTSANEDSHCSVLIALPDKPARTYSVSKSYHY
jgi:hypothetical protein